MQEEVVVGNQAGNEEDIRNALLVLIMYRGQTSWSAAVGSDIYFWGRNWYEVNHPRVLLTAGR